MKNICDFLFRPKAHNAEDPFEVQKRLFDTAANPVIFDVGAYVGDVTATYKKLFPQSTIYCFEPFDDSFQKLSQACRDASIHAYQMAFSDKEGAATLHINADSSCNSFFPRPKSGFKYYPQNSENIRETQVQTSTLDSFCDDNKIFKIDILKLDVEGAEIRVLKGASERLKSRQIGLVYSEVIFIPHYEGGCLFHEVADFLHQYDYTLLNLYNLKLARNGQLRWGNAIFLSPQIRTRVDAT